MSIIKGNLWIVILIVIFVVCLFAQILLPTKTCEHFNVKESPFKETSLSKKDHRVLLSIMKRLDALLKANNLSYFVIAGSLMGAMRYGNRMPWDDDIDIGMMAEEKQRFEQLPFATYGLAITRVSFGYKVYDANIHRRAKLEGVFPFVDVFTFVADNGRYVYEGKYARNKWPKEFFTPEQLYPLSTCEYAGMSLPCPSQSKEFLSQAFPGWDTMAYISGSHTGGLLFRKYKMPINKVTNAQVLAHIDELTYG